MKKGLLIAAIIMLLVMLGVTGCGSASDYDESDDAYTQDTEVAEDTFEDEPGPLEGKWTDELGISTLVVEGDKAVFDDICVGTCHGEELDFPNDYEKVETNLIDGKLYLTITPKDYVIEESGLPEDYTNTIALIKVEE